MSEEAMLSTAAIVQKKLLASLACPITRGEVEVLPLVVAAGAVKEAILWSRRLNAVVGEVKNYQIDFVRFESSIDVDAVRARLALGQLPSPAEWQEVWTVSHCNSGHFQYGGDWRPIGDMMVTDCVQTPATIRWNIDRHCRIVFGAHPWSGLVDVLVDGTIVHQLDLYEPHTTVPRSVLVKPTRSDVSSEVVVVARGVRSPQAMGCQCLFSRCETATAAFEPSRVEKQFSSRGASYTERFKDMLAAVPTSGLCLDLGGGNRQIDDARYVNLDYAPYDEPDVIGDALSLPFQDGIFDLVYSTGVIEHLKDPIRVGKEIHRVTKPEGRVLVGMAFMQPIHSEEQHFFNATIWGIQEIFKSFRNDDVFWEGSMSFLINWMLQCTHVDSRADAREIRQVLEAVEKWDELIKYDRLKYIANGVWFCGTKV